MRKNIITASGTATEIFEKLRFLRGFFPEGATLSDLAKVKKFATLTTATRRQLEEIEKGRAKK